eukprot:9294426-Pyramimonas_sp.AAC.1
MVFSGGQFLDSGAGLEGPKTMTWHDAGNNDASAAAGARFGTSGNAEMRPTLQREHDSERAEARK